MAIPIKTISYNRTIRKQAMKNNFFANKIVQGFLIREKRQFVLPDGDDTGAHEKEVAAILADIAQLGFTVDGPGTLALQKQSINSLAHIREMLVEQLKTVVGAHVKYRPLFRKFPDDIPDDMEYLVRKLFGYLDTYFKVTTEHHTVLSCGHIVNHDLFDLKDFGACPVCQRAAPELDASKPNLLPLKELTPLKVLSITSAEQVLGTFVNATQSRTSLSASYQEFMREVLRVESEAVASMLPATIPFKENMALVVGMLLQGGVSHDELGSYVKTTTDVLRIATALSGGDLSLADVCRFKLTSSQRRFIMSTLEKLPQSEKQMLEDMVGYLGRWIRIGEVLHVGQFAHRYPKTVSCFEVLRKRPGTIDTFNSQVAVLFEQKTLMTEERAMLLKLLSNRPGEFARKLDSLVLKAGNAAGQVLDKFGMVISAVSTPILLTLLAHFRTRGEVSQFRAFMPKGSVAKMFITEGDNRAPLSISLRSDIISMTRAELMSRFAKKGSLGKVFIDEALDGVLVPFSQRSASTGLVNVPRGSRIAYDASKGFLRMFVHWMENSESGTIDLDLSAGLYTDEWNMLGQMSWTNMGSYGRSTHSGDVRSAPAPVGGSEFIDLDLNALRKNGVRYVLMMVFSWTGQPFKSFDAFAGVMERDEPKRGDHFEPQTVTNKFEVAGDSKAMAPMMLDVETGEIVWMDMTIKTGAYGSVESQGGRMVAMAKAINGLRESRVSLYDLFELHAATRGTMVASKEEADTVLDLNQLQNMDDIVSNWL